MKISAKWFLPKATIPIEVIFFGLILLDKNELDLLKVSIGNLKTWNSFFTLKSIW